MVKLDNLKPINNSDAPQKQEFLQKVASKLQESHRLKDLQTEAQSTLVSLEDIETISKPLGELGEREVKHNQIKLIYEELNQIENNLKFKEGAVKQSGMDSD